MICISALYANLPGSQFDPDYYLTKHAPLAIDLLRPHGLKGIRLSVGISDLAGAAPPFWAISEMLFESRAQFDQAMGLCGEKLARDAGNYTDVTPTLQLSTLATQSRNFGNLPGEA